LFRFEAKLLNRSEAKNLKRKKAKKSGKKQKKVKKSEKKRKNRLEFCFWEAKRKI
jgi:hypothetical protein